MKVSKEWLQTFFEKPLPDADKLADALTFHAFEIESVENDILDVKVTPNRGHDCLSHRGIAKEIAAILDLPIQNDALRQRIELHPKTDAVSVAIADPVLCQRYIAAYIKGVKVGPSPDWLRERLESIGQRSINNIVDIANFVMFNIGQPLHAFDAGKFASKDGTYIVGVRSAKEGESIVALDGKTYELDPSMLVISDGTPGKPIGIAGVKGGKEAEVNETTTDLILESANFNGVSLRRTAQRLKFRTDASTRFEQVISPWLAPFAMKEFVSLLLQEAGGELVGFSEDYALAPEKRRVSASLEKINGILGSNLSGREVADALRRLDLSHIEEGGVFDVHVPFERLDLQIEEDIVEEVGRIIGYDKIKSAELPSLKKQPEINADFYAAEQKREELISKGFSEVYTSVFADKGERVVANKVDGVRPYLRTRLRDGLEVAMMKNLGNKDLLGLDRIKLFEIGAVWKDGKEETHIATLEEEPKQKKGAHKLEGREENLERANADRYDDLPLTSAERYQPFSRYPYIVRDIAMWVPFDVAEGKPAATPEEVLEIIKKNAGELLVRGHLFDRFEKDDKVSLAFRIVFQSFDRTLTDFDANERMQSISSALQKHGFTIR